MNFSKSIIAVLIIASAFSCEELNLKTAETDIAVVECYMSPGSGTTVNINRQIVYNSNDTLSEYINGLNVTISSGSNKIELVNAGDGEYQSEDHMFKAGGEYSIEFIYNNKVVSASTIIPLKPGNFTTSSTSFTAPEFSGPPSSDDMSDPITLSWTNPNEDYHMVVIENIESTLELINSFNGAPVRAFRNAPTTADSLEIPPMSFSYYGTHRIVLFKLNAEYAALYEQLGTSSLDISAPPSNVENGLGIFTGINSDTLYIEVI